MTEPNKADQAKDIAKKSLSFAKTKGAETFEQAKAKAKEISDKSAQKKTATASGGFLLQPRRNPKHTTIVEQSSEKAVILIPAMRDSWVKAILLYLFIIAPILLAISIGLGFHTENVRYMGWLCENGSGLADILSLQNLDK